MTLRGYFWLHDVARAPFDPAARPDAFAYMTFIYYPTWTRLDGLLAGVAIAAIQTFSPQWWRRLTARPNVLLGVGVAGVGIAIVFFHDMIAGFLPAVFGFPILACAMALLVIAGSDERSLIGRYSIPGAGALAAGAYSLYLSNKIVFHAVQRMIRDSPVQIQSVALCAGLLAALAAGALLYWLVERPFLRLRDRLRSPSRSGVRAPVPASAPERLLAD
jgi:peptidoglycan/LPS O-acetylase OafA/YrhL